MTEILLVDAHTHRIGKRNGVWAMYCPERGPDNLILIISFDFVINALSMNTPCPHDAILDPWHPALWVRKSHD